MTEEIKKVKLYFIFCEINAIGSSSSKIFVAMTMFRYHFERAYQRLTVFTYCGPMDYR